MLSPSEGKEIYERVIVHLEEGHDMTPEDVAALMQAAESGYPPAQNAYANVLNNVEGNLLAALPWYCKAAQKGDEEAWNTLRELYAAETLVREQVGQYLSVEQLIELRKRKPDRAEENTPERHSILASLIFIITVLVGGFWLDDGTARIIVMVTGVLLAMLAELHYQRTR